MLRHLELGGRVPGNPATAPLARSGRVAVKCGIYAGYAHMQLYFRSASGSREFVISIMTRNYVWNALGERLFGDLLALI